jgi:hypothetical protein
MPARSVHFSCFAVGWLRCFLRQPPVMNGAWNCPGSIATTDVQFQRWKTRPISITQKFLNAGGYAVMSFAPFAPFFRSRDGKYIFETAIVQKVAGNSKSVRESGNREKKRKRRKKNEQNRKVQKPNRLVITITPVVRCRDPFAEKEPA